MLHRNFYIGIIFQVICIAITPILFLIVHSREYMLVTTYSLVLLWIGQIVYLIYYINAINRDLVKFFGAFQYQDATIVFSEINKDKSFRKLHQSFNGIINAFGKVKIEKEKDFTFFQNTLQLVGIGLLAFDKKDEVRLCNKAFQDLFQIGEFRQISFLNGVNEDFTQFLKQLITGKEEFKKYLICNEIKSLAVKAVEFRLEDETIKLVAFQDIKNAIDQNEMEAMHKLIRVFTHEILNSVSPISLLSSSLISSFENLNNEPLDEELLTTTLIGLETIRKRSKGLMSFVDDYKNLNRIPKPNFDSFQVNRLFQHIQVLFEEECRAEGIELVIKQTCAQQELIADEKLLSQVLINLLRNAIHALKDGNEKLINLSFEQKEGHAFIKLSDNGVGIPQDILEHIFTPFFTTKEKGSGIGLNLSRQIMRLHGGNISVSSQDGKGSEFVMSF